jgi:carbon-monoxide dehydrogenase medium subunit
VLPLIAHPAIRNRGTIGGSLAHADPAAELPAVAVLCDAELVVVGPAGERVIPAADFFESYLTTALAVDEVLTEIRFPTHERTGFAFREVSRRHGDFALVGAGARVTVDAAGDVVDQRLVFIGVGGTPVVAEDASQLDPPDDVHASAAYRRHVAGVLARDVLETARGRA